MGSFRQRGERGTGGGFVIVGTMYQCTLSLNVYVHVVEEQYKTD